MFDVGGGDRYAVIERHDGADGGETDVRSAEIELDARMGSRDAVKAENPVKKFRMMGRERVPKKGMARTRA